MHGKYCKSWMLFDEVADMNKLCTYSGLRIINDFYKPSPVRSGGDRTQGLRASILPEFFHSSSSVGFTTLKDCDY